MVIMNYAVIDPDGLIVNVVVYNGTDSWQPPENCTAVALPSGSEAQAGWFHDEGEFVPFRTSPLP